MTTSTHSSGNRAASGTQFIVRNGQSTATITSLAAGLRRYKRNGIALVESYPENEVAPGAAGLTLAPFANRIDGGLWQLDGAPQQLDITEVALNNAIHGLLRNTGYHALEQSESHVLLEAVIHPQHGYPFLARHQVRYELDAQGHLRVAQTLINDSARKAPFVLGAHPYFTVGDADPQTLVIQANAGAYLPVNDRMIPSAAVPVTGHYDLREGRPVPDSLMDTAFTQLLTDDGVGRHTLSAPDGRSVSLWHDGSVEYVHIYITKNFPHRTLAIAMEPMSGPANAFNSGDGLKWLEPGTSFTMTWGIESSL